MKRIINYLFGYWEVEAAFVGKWNISSDFGDYNEQCTFEILKLRGDNIYRIKTKGYRPKKHQLYPTVVDIMSVMKNKVYSKPTT